MKIVSTFTTSDGAEYAELPSGAIKHLNPHPFTYDAAYSAVYDSPERVRLSDQLQALRYVFATTAHGKKIQSITDVGFGNGAFMKYVRRFIPNVMGLDITDVPVPEGCTRIEQYQECDVISFHDCLEHFPDLDFVGDLPCKTLIVSLPFCHIHTRGREWFDKQYFHRKPSEHIWHFNDGSLRAELYQYGWYHVATSNHEDIVRKRDEEWNILSMAFKRN